MGSEYRPKTYEVCVYVQTYAVSPEDARQNVYWELTDNTGLSFEILDDAVEEVTSELS